MNGVNTIGMSWARRAVLAGLAVTAAALASAGGAMAASAAPASSRCIASADSAAPTYYAWSAMSCRSDTDAQGINW